MILNFLKYLVLLNSKITNHYLICFFAMFTKTKLSLDTIFLNSKSEYQTNSNANQFSKTKKYFSNLDLTKTLPKNKFFQIISQVCKLALRVLCPLLFRSQNPDFQSDNCSSEDPPEPEPITISLEEQNRQTQIMLNEYFEQACKIQQILEPEFKKQKQKMEVEVVQKEVQVSYKEQCYKNIG